MLFSDAPTLEAYNESKALSTGGMIYKYGLDIITLMDDKKGKNYIGIMISYQPTPAIPLIEWHSVYQVYNHVVSASE